MPKSRARFGLITLAAVTGVALLCAYFYVTTNDYRSLNFTDATVLMKYRSKNHGYLSVRVRTSDNREFAVEGIPEAAWLNLSVGSKISKDSGASDVTIQTP